MAPVVSDKMHYGLKPIAVESKAHALTIPCISMNSYKGDTPNTTIFFIYNTIQADGISIHKQHASNVP